MNLPGISIITPTLNSAKTIALCLEAVLCQDYPKEKVELIIADGGSTDATIEIVNSMLSGRQYQVVVNSLKTGEAGKAVGVKQARNEIVALIDSDNILPRPDWLRQMVAPFADPEIAASEPLRYTYRRGDKWITRYCALLGMNDPVCLFLGNYDRYCLLTGTWTEVGFRAEDKGGYLKIEFPDPRRLPTIGANGFFIRREILQKYGIGDYLFDIDIICDLVAGGDYRIAKVKTGIIHLFSGNIKQFAGKQRRRIRDYRYYNEQGLRKYQWGSLNTKGLLKFIFYSLTVIPLVVQTVRGLCRQLDWAWLFHLPACLVSLYVYGTGTVVSFFKGAAAESRSSWQKK